MCDIPIAFNMPKGSHPKKQSPKVALTPVLDTLGVTLVKKDLGKNIPPKTTSKKA